MVCLLVRVLNANLPHTKLNSDLFKVKLVKIRFTSEGFDRAMLLAHRLYQVNIYRSFEIIYMPSTGMFFFIRTNDFRRFLDSFRLVVKLFIIPKYAQKGFLLTFRLRTRYTQRIMERKGKLYRVHCSAYRKPLEAVKVNI